MKKIFVFILMLMLIFNTSAFGASNEDIFLNSVKNEDIKTGSIGGEWLVIAKARGNGDKSFDAYYNNLCSELEENKGEIDRKYTTYSRIIIALTAIGKNPCDVAGYDLTTRLEDYDNVTRQGLNGAIFALIATKCSGCKNYSCEDYLRDILVSQNDDGSFSLGGGGDVDITAMALQALSFYTYRENVRTAISKALVWLETSKPSTSEGLAQMLIAYTSLSDFVPKEKIDSVYNNLQSYAVKGGYCHIKGEDFNAMSSEQAACAYAAYKRYISRDFPLYKMNNSRKCVYDR